MFDTKLTNYCASQQACGRDLVAEFVEAARAEGLRVGFYYSLMDWHHPDGWRCSTDEAARARFVEYTHGLIRELMTQYGKIDVLWYDGDWPLNAEQWEAEKMNKMVYQLQPDIIINNRNGLPGDFSTPEQHIEPAKGGGAWESCMTMNESWGYQKADKDWKPPETIVRNLITCGRDAGNYLLNIGPKPDGSVPEESVRILTEVGEWMDKNGPTIYESEPCQPRGHVYASYTRKGNTLYMHIFHWPGETPASNGLEFFNPPSVVAIGGLRAKVKSARLFASGKPVTFEQGDQYVRFTGLPLEAPDSPVTVLAIECDAKPAIDSSDVRKFRKREEVGI
jgi:alpha-L-fucosidase